MKSPLQYQRTEYDCGPTSFMNAVSFLFNREEIPPEVLRNVMLYTLDSYNSKGEACKHGTSQMAMSFVAGWLNQYAKAAKFPIACEFIEDDDVHISSNSQIISALQQGGAVVLWVHYGTWHYVTLTGACGGSVELFDPYYRKQSFKQKGIELVKDKPFTANRSVPFSYLDSTGKTIYALGPVKDRAAVILYNTTTRKTAEQTIEYFL